MDRKSHSKTLIPEVKSIRLNELENFVKSDFYQKFPIVPISPSRAKSYTENLHGKPADVVLILAFLNDELVAFRSLFAGMVQTGNEKIHFGWCSGNWVHPGFRRKGLSKLLLTEAYSAWNGKLMFTNYAPESEKLYLQTGWFRAIHHFKGARAYLYPKTVKLIPFAQKNKLTKQAFLLVDFCIACYSNLKVRFLSYHRNPEIQFEVRDFPDEESYRFFENYKANFLFNRGKKELTWIFKFPWISALNSEIAGKYPFSAFTNSFYYQTVKVWQNDELSGVFIFSVREGHLKTLFFLLSSGMEKDTARFLKHFCAQHKIEMLTVYNSAVAHQLFARKFPFLHVRKYGQKIYSSFDVGKSENIQFQDGDGDTFFS